MYSVKDMFNTLEAVTGQVIFVIREVAYTSNKNRVKPVESL